MTTRNSYGVYTASYPEHVLIFVAERYATGMLYRSIAHEVRKQYKLAHFNENNVAGIVSRLRARGLDLPRRIAGTRSKSPTRGDKVPQAAITLPKV